MKFTELNLSEFILKTMEELGFTEATEIQEKCIPEIMSGKDVIGKSQTGSGKTFAYGIPAINMVDTTLKATQVLVVCPTRELASQVCEEFRKITNNTESIRVVPVFGGSNMQRQIDALKNAKIVVGTPGRLMDHLRRKTLKLNNLKTIILDEADEMLNMGFKEDIETILKSVNQEHQTIMFSATMPKPILNLTKEFMKEDAKFIEIGSSLQLVDTIEQNFVFHDKKDAVVKLLQQYKPQVGIVFCDTIKMVEEITKILNENEISALALHGDMRQSARKKNLIDLKSGKTNILVGTDVAARGLDIKNVDIVINFDLPYDVEYYVHRIGRTGRAGSNGVAISLINSQIQRKQLAFIEREIKSSINQILLDDDVYVAGDKSTESLERKRNTGDKQRGRHSSDGFHKDFKRSSDRRDRSSDNRFGRDKKTFEKSERNFDRENKSYEKSDRQTDKKFDRPSRDYKKSEKSFNRQNKSFDKPVRKFDRDSKSFDKSERNFDREKKNFDRPSRTKRFESNETSEKTFEKRSFERKSSFRKDTRNGDFSQRKRYDRPRTEDSEVKSNFKPQNKRQNNGSNENKRDFQRDNGEKRNNFYSENSRPKKREDRFSKESKFDNKKFKSSNFRSKPKTEGHSFHKDDAEKSIKEKKARPFDKFRK